MLALDVVPARAQMGSSLAFHIILACMGIAFPAIVLVVHYRGLRRKDEVALLLARRWSRVMAVLVAVGAVSGTVLSFDMGLLWPGLMGRYGSVIGIPFSFEGIFFLLEAVFTAIYLYGWDRLPPWAHLWTLVPVVLTGILGAMSVVAANSWMNDPSGFTMAHGRITSVDPVAVFFNGATYYEVPHMILAAYMVAGGLAATPYAVGLLRGRRDRYTRLGFLVPFTVAAIATPFQIGVGDTAARAIASNQPIKFATMEYVPQTTRGSDRMARRDLGQWPCRGRDSDPRPGLAAGGLLAALPGGGLDERARFAAAAAADAHTPELRRDGVHRHR